MGVTFPQGRSYRQINPLSITQDLVVPEPDHSISFTFKRCCAGCIDIGAMLPSIDLDDEFRPMVAEIRDELADRNLSSKMVVGEMFTQHHP